MLLTIGERLEDLRKERSLTLNELAKATKISRSALNKYEHNDFKDISPFSITTLAKFYGVTADYLMGLSDMKNPSNTEIHELHLSDKMLEVLKSGKLNNYLLGEIVAHKYFQKLMLDIEVYVDRIASMQVANLNAWLSAIEREVVNRYHPDENDLHMNTLKAAYIDEDSFFLHTVHLDFDSIIGDIKDAYKETEAPSAGNDQADRMMQNVVQALSAKNMDLETVSRFICKELHIKYDKLSKDEVLTLIGILQKSDDLKSAISRRGKAGLPKR